MVHHPRACLHPLLARCPLGAVQETVPVSSAHHNCPGVTLSSEERQMYEVFLVPNCQESRDQSYSQRQAPRNSIKIAS